MDSSPWLAYVGVPMNIDVADIGAMRERNKGN